MRWWFLILYWCTVSRKEWECLCKTFEINLHIFVYFKILFNIIDWFLPALAIFPFIFWCVSYLRVLFQSSALGLLEGPASAWLMLCLLFSYLSQVVCLHTPLDIPRLYQVCHHAKMKAFVFRNPEFAQNVLPITACLELLHLLHLAGIQKVKSFSVFELSILWDL